MITMTPSTASSPSRVKAPQHPVLGGHRDGISVIAYPSAAAEVAMASRVRTLPVVERVNRMTPMRAELAAS